MFSSNQVFEVSCTKSQLRAVLAFALDLANDERTRPRNLVYQTTSDGRFAIGWFHQEPKAGWQTACVAHTFCGPACGSGNPVSEGVPGPLDRVMGRVL